MVLNTVSWALQYYGITKITEDEKLQKKHLDILVYDVAPDLKVALKFPDIIPEKYRNHFDLGSIANVI